MVNVLLSIVIAGVGTLGIYIAVAFVKMAIDAFRD